MSDPKYNKYAGTVRFDDDNIVDIDLQPDTENIRVLLNGSEVTGGSELPEVDSGDNGKVLTVVSGEWAAATPATPPAELPSVTSADNGDVLTVVNGAWAKAEKTLVLYSSFSVDPYVPSDAPSLSGGLEWADAADGDNPTLPLFFDEELENELTLSDFQDLPANVIIKAGKVEFIPTAKRYIEQLNDPIEAYDTISASYDCILVSNDGNISSVRFCGFMLTVARGLG